MKLTEQQEKEAIRRNKIGYLGSDFIRGKANFYIFNIFSQEMISTNVIVDKNSHKLLTKFQYNKPPSAEEQMRLTNSNWPRTIFNK